MIELNWNTMEDHNVIKLFDEGDQLTDHEKELG